MLLTFPLSKIETKTQEIVLLVTYLLSAWVLLLGIFYLTLPAESNIAVAGKLGFSFADFLFKQLGLAFFVLPVSILFIAKYILSRILNISDLKRYLLPLGVQISLQVFILLLISSSLSVLESFFGNFFLLSKDVLFSTGGELGLLFGGNLYALLGLSGSAVILFSLASVFAIIFHKLDVVNSIITISEGINVLSVIIFKNLLWALRKTSNQALRAGVQTGIQTKALMFLHPKTARVYIRVENFSKRLSFLSYFSNRSEAIDLDFVADDSNGSMEGASANILGVSGDKPKGFEVLNSNYNYLRGLNHNLEEVNKNILKEKRSKNKRTLSMVDKEVAKAGVVGAEKENILRCQKEDAQDSKFSSQKKEKIIDQVIKDKKQEATQENKDKIFIKKYTKKYIKPEINLLKSSEKSKSMSKDEVSKLSNKLEDQLHSFQIFGKIVAVHVGASLTLFEFEPEKGVKLSKINALTNDLALVLGAPSIRILTPIPGKMTVGIEVPNKNPHVVNFSEQVTAVVKKKDKALPISLGKDVNNEVRLSDISEMPHLLISGTTGSGKSVFINSLIASLLYTKSPKDLRFIMIDPKMIELSPYNGIPHLLKPVITDVTKAKDALLWVEKEMDKRYQMLFDMGARNITSFNEQMKKTSKKALELRNKTQINWEWMEMPYIVVVIDELADLMITQGREVEIPITRIAQKSRACGIHLVIATQRPSADVVTGLIKTNFPTRIAFKVSSGIDSRTILDSSGAEKLLGNGDMLFMSNGKSLERLQASYISEEEVRKIVGQLKNDTK